MQAVVQRNVDQEQRINGGIQAGQLTTQETGILQNDESHNAEAEATAAGTGPVLKSEAEQINQVENTSSQKIYEERHDP